MGSCRTVRNAALTFTAAIAILVSGSFAYAEPTPAERDRQLASAWQELEGVIERYDALRDEQQATAAKRARVAADLVPLTAAVEAAQARTSELANGLYRGGDIGGLSSLMTAGSPDAFLDQLTVLDHLSRTRSREYAALAADRSRLDGQQHELDRLDREQHGRQVDLAARKTAIEGQIRQLEGLRGRAYRGARSPGNAIHDGYVPAYSADAAGAAVRFVYAQLGKVYRWGADGPDAYDCSGLTMAAWKSAGVILPHNAASQSHTVRPIGRAQLRPGDLVFYYKNVSHVAMYIGNDRVIEAPQVGERISMRDLNFAPIVGYGRPA